MMDNPISPRSLLFVPAVRPDMLAKVPQISPDAVVVDLEDAVAPSDKDTVRQALPGCLAGWMAGHPKLFVRINPPGTPWHIDDVAVVAETLASGIVLPKLSRRGEAEELRRMLESHGRSDMSVLAGIETALGVADARSLLEAADAVYFGAEDYIADLGGRRTPESYEVLYARSQVVLAARLAGIAAIDQAVVAVHDEKRFMVDALDGRDMGYVGKICLHPTQVALAQNVFTPSDEELERARAVIDAAKAGIGLVAGEMVDEAHVKMATSVLRRYGEIDR